jgi:hypothetical protein
MVRRRDDGKEMSDTRLLKGNKQSWQNNLPQNLALDDNILTISKNPYECAMDIAVSPSQDTLEGLDPASRSIFTTPAFPAAAATINTV